MAPGLLATAPRETPTKAIMPLFKTPYGWWANPGQRSVLRSRHRRRHADGRTTPGCAPARIELRHVLRPPATEDGLALDRKRSVWSLGAVNVLRRLTCDIPPPGDLRRWPVFGDPGATFPRDVGPGTLGLALVVLSVVEQRLDAVRAVLDGAEVAEVAAQMGCTGRQCTGAISRDADFRRAGATSRPTPSPCSRSREYVTPPCRRLTPGSWPR